MNSPQLDFEEWPYRCDFIPNPHVSVLCAPPGSPNHQQRIETSGKAIIALAWTNVIEKAKHEANGQVIPCWSMLISQRVSYGQYESQWNFNEFYDYEIQS